MTGMRKILGLASLAGCAVIMLAGCNDTLRQFITPVPQPGGNPAGLAHAIVLSQNPAGNGSMFHIDVAGDTVAGVVNTGPSPLFFGKSSNRVFVMNSDNTITSYIALNPLGTAPNTITQPSSASGAIGGGASSVGNFYTVNENSGNASVISGVFAVTGTVGVGADPVAIAANSNTTRIYVVNHASNSVTPISTIDDTVFPDIAVGTQPIWAVMSTDAVHVFVVNQGDGTNPGSVSVIDTLLNQVIATIPVGISPNYAVYESKLQRLYVSNTGSQTVSVIDASRIDLAAVPQLLPRKLADVPVSGTPTSVAALSDGTRAYAALGNCPAGTNQTNLVQPPAPNLPNCNGSLVSVIDVSALREIKTIPVGPGAVSIDASPDASRVYVVSANDTTTIADNVNTPATPSRTFPAPSVSVITTATDTVFRPSTDASVIGLAPTFHVPQQDASCVPAIDPAFNNKVPLPCPLQSDFLVRTFP